MDGIEFLQKIMPTKPMPVVMITAVDIKAGEDVLKALELGAVDYIHKPGFGTDERDVRPHL